MVTVSSSSSRTFPSRRVSVYSVYFAASWGSILSKPCTRAFSAPGGVRVGREREHRQFGRAGDVLGRGHRRKPVRAEDLGLEAEPRPQVEPAVVAVGVALVRAEHEERDRAARDRKSGVWGTSGRG